MSLEDLRKRYLWIAKTSLSFLKDHGFQKKGNKYIKQKGDFILKIYPYVPKPGANSENFYGFGMTWELLSLDPKLIHLSIFMGASKNSKEAYITSAEVSSGGPVRAMSLRENDPHDFDHVYAEGIQKEITTTILPFFNQIHSMDDVIRFAEKDEELPREQRKYFELTDRSLARFYAYKGWKEKSLAMCNKDIEGIPETSRYLGEERKKRYIQYFEKIKGI